MSFIRTFELFQGGVLAKILRSDKPISLRMIETRPKEDWSTYTLNGEVDLFIKYSKAPRAYSQKSGGTSWTFPLSKNQLRQINKPNKRPVYVALVCVRKDKPFSETPACFLEPKDIDRLSGLNSTISSITLRLPNSGGFRVLHKKRELFIVPRNKLQKWIVPGS